MSVLIFITTLHLNDNKNNDTCGEWSNKILSSEMRYDNGTGYFQSSEFRDGIHYLYLHR